MSPRRADHANGPTLNHAPRQVCEVAHGPCHSKARRTRCRTLDKGRFDLFPFDRLAGQYEVHRLGLQAAIASCDRVRFSKRYSAAISKRSTYPDIQRLVARFDEELAAIKRSGEHQKILVRWVGDMRVGRQRPDLQYLCMAVHIMHIVDII